MSDHRTENCDKPCASGMRVRAGDGLKTSLYDRCTEHCETTLLWQWDSEQNGAPMPEHIWGQRAKGMAAMLGGPHSETHIHAWAAKSGCPVRVDMRLYQQRRMLTTAKTVLNICILKEE